MYPHFVTGEYIYIYIYLKEGEYIFILNIKHKINFNVFKDFDSCYIFFELKINIKHVYK